jgi:SAM-dependent methyltransferase
VGVDAIPPAADAGVADAGSSADPAPAAGAREPRPANYRFVAANLLERLPFEDASFDYVHQRLLYSAIPAPRWPDEVRELARVTRPGGWVELVEGSLGSTKGTVGPAMRQLFDWAVAVTGQREIDLGIGTRLHTFLRSAGLSNVTQREIALPIGARGGRLGTMVEADLLSVTTGLRAPIIMLGLTDGDTFDQTLAAWRAEMQTHDYSWPIYVAFGQRAR